MTGRELSPRSAAWLLSGVLHLAVVAGAVAWSPSPTPPAFEATVENRHADRASVDPVGPAGASSSRGTNAAGDSAIVNGIRSQIPAWSAILLHIVQSTIFACVAFALTRLVRQNMARVRYAIWFAASLKFLLPFSLFVSLGASLPVTPQIASGSFLPFVITEPPTVSTVPFALAAVSELDLSASVGSALWFVWLFGATAVSVMRFRRWDRIRQMVEASEPLAVPGVMLPRGGIIRSSAGVLEPAVVGWWRPVLFLPRGIGDVLTRPQLEAVIAHERWHIARRDNFSAAVQMFAEVAFWFYPLVWWIGARLIEERERACDEGVLSDGHDPREYADGIVGVCRHYLDARLACIAGVTGADLQGRLHAIMTRRVGHALGRRRKALLAAAAAAAIAVPIGVGAASRPPIGVLQGGQTGAEFRFEEASVKQNRSGRPDYRIQGLPGGRFTATNATLAALVRFAYELPPFQVTGGPDWFRSDRFDVVAKAEGEPSLAEKRLMVRRLLAERFALTMHTEPREMPVFLLRPSRNDGRLGPQLRRSNAPCDRSDQPSLDSGFRPVPPDGVPACGYLGFSPESRFSAGVGGFAFRGITMSGLAKMLVPALNRSVVDRTGLDGYYDGEFDLLAEIPPPPPPPGVPNPFTEPFVSVFTVFPEQLGLKLESQKGQVEMLIVDSATPLTPD